MTWKTHIAIGANSVWLAGLTGHWDGSILILLPTAMLASILPDIDAAGGGAKIHYIGGGVLSNFRGFHGKYFHHRAIMHSLFVSFIFFLILFATNLLFLNNAYPLLAFVFMLSYFSHPLIDGLNTSVGYFYPFWRKKFALLPYGMLTRVNGFADNLLFVIGMAGILLFFLLYSISLMRLPNALTG